MINRLFQIVYMLLEKPQMKAKALAEFFEVSERTIYRDIDKLTMAGIPIYTNQGRNGGISILPDYVLDKSVLTIDEKKKIMESLNALNEVSVSKNSESISKLRSFFGGQYQDWIEIDFSSWESTLEDKVLFEKIKNAILEHFYIEIIYSGSKESFVKRRIKPVKLCFKNQSWYLYAYCCLREDYRFFKLKRMSQINVSNEHFEPENVEKVLSKVSKEYCEQLKSVLVTLEISQEMAFRAYEELRNIQVTDNGKLLCNVEVTDINWFISYVLSYGSYIRILEPVEIKEKVMQEIKKMNNLYGGNDGV